MQQGALVAVRAGACYLLQLLFAWSSDNVGDQLKLVRDVSPREQRPAQDDLKSTDTSQLLALRPLVQGTFLC